MHPEKVSQNEALISRRIGVDAYPLITHQSLLTCTANVRQLTVTDQAPRRSRQFAFGARVPLCKYPWKETYKTLDNN